MNQDKSISIDSALSQLLSRPAPIQGVYYADFLEKLAAHDQQNIPVDLALQERLKTSTALPQGSWKSILLLIWYRRFKKAAIFILIIFALGLGINTLLDKKYLADKTVQNRPVSPSKIIPESSLKPDYDHSLKTIQDPIHAEKSPEVKKYIKSPIKQPGNAKSPHSEKAGMNPPNSNSIESFRFGLTLRSKPASNVFAFELDQHEPGIMISAPLFADLPAKRLNLKSNYVIGFHLMTSFQHYHSDINRSEARNTNRNYEALAQNGQLPGQVINFGFSFEKPVYKALGISIGLQKFTLEQVQKTNFILSEVPVYDLDGQIAGYIDINPENIRGTIVNKLHYVAMPIQLMYDVHLNRSYHFQLKSGSSVLGLMDQHIQKFDYKTLELNGYANDRSKLSMNNLQFGLNCTRKLQNNFMISAGYEFQWLRDIHPISDQTEQVNANLHSFILSLKYQR